MATPELTDWRSQRDAALATVERNAGEDFFDAARLHVIDYLTNIGPASSEKIVNSGEACGIYAHDARAWGPVFLSLSRKGLIFKAGFCQRTKGHGTSGGIIWKIV